jgi:hypothetical protein
MQTFLPFEDFTECAKVLDYRRLGKQRVESWQILNALAGNSKGWVNHPAVRMWRGYERCLIDYNLAICKEWVAKGYKDTMTDKTLLFLDVFKNNSGAPKWLGNKHLHDSYKGILFHKNKEHYQQFMPYLNFDKVLWPF